MADLTYATHAVSVVEDSVDLSAGGSYSPARQQAIHIGALVCALFSLVTVLVTLRWFLLMRRTFRHHLVMCLIISDASKAIWYFIFPIVTFVTGPVASESNFCQASGFLLTFSVEAADMSILIIAVHSILYILRPNNALGEGGLYPYRYWIVPAWLVFPLFASSMVFIADKHPYTTAGTFCYLAKRPIWYRLAFAWVPRYIIIAIILIMYIWIYVYVTLKFRGFDNLGNSSTGSPQGSRRKSAFSPDAEDVEGNPMDAARAPSLRPQLQEAPTEQSLAGSQQLQPWDHMNFITSKALNTPVGTPAEDVPPPLEARGSEWSGDTQFPPGRSSVRASVADPHTSGSSSATADTPKQLEIPPNTLFQNGTTDDNDPLKKTRIAIRKQLRYLFVYPLVYIIVWTFPFVAQIQLYNEYYVRHPVYWLNLVQILMLALQAGADSVIFSWTEKPWRNIDPNSKFALPNLRNRLRGKACDNGPAITVQPAMSESTSPKRMTLWWDAEARRRKDSVFLGGGTFGDTLSHIASRTRSRSPEKKRGLHSRKKSADLVRANPFRRTTAATLTPVTSNDSGHPGRISTQSGRTAPDSVPERSGRDSLG